MSEETGRERGHGRASLRGAQAMLVIWPPLTVTNGDWVKFESRTVPVRGNERNSRKVTAHRERTKSVYAMQAMANLYRLSAFTLTPEGGNPAGVWLGDQLPDPADMQRIAAEVGFSETAFVAPASGRHRTIRYYSPEAEVSFCGHATIAVLSCRGPAIARATHPSNPQPQHPRPTPRVGPVTAAPDASPLSGSDGVCGKIYESGWLPHLAGRMARHGWVRRWV